MLRHVHSLLLALSPGSQDQRLLSSVQGWQPLGLARGSRPDSESDQLLSPEQAAHFALVIAAQPILIQSLQVSVAHLIELDFLRFMFVLCLVFLILQLLLIWLVRCHLFGLRIVVLLLQRRLLALWFDLQGWYLSLLSLGLLSSSFTPHSRSDTSPDALVLRLWTPPSRVDLSSWHLAPVYQSTDSPFAHWEHPRLFANRTDP